MASPTDLDVALDLADLADELTLGRFGAADLRVSTKPDLTPVSDADRACEAALRARLAELRPDDGILGEEEGEKTGGSTRRWIIDPIDGTKNYVRGVPVWASLIGLVDSTDIILGVVSAPALGRRWWAASGGGAWCRWRGEVRRLRVSNVADLSDASLAYSSLTGWRDLKIRDRWLDLMDRVWRTRAPGDFWSYMLLAEGAVDIAAEPELALHDMAALVPIVTEAGGTFTSLTGTPGPWGGNAVATNGLLHAAVLEALGPIPQ